jgi:hypothetical protein
MNGQARTIRRPALLGVVAASALVAALAASWTLAASAEAMRPGWGAKAALILIKGSPDSELTADVPSDL